MTIQAWLIYLTLVLVATATPGPAVLFIMTSATLHGWRKAVFAALGNITGLLFLGILAVAGLGAVLKTSEILFDLLRYGGAAYLVFLGLKQMSRKRSHVPASHRSTFSSRASAGRIYLQAMGVALSNPKAIVFLSALFPQFIDVGQALIPQFSILIATLMVFSFSFLMGYALLAHSAKRWLAVPGRVTAVNRTSGSVFIFFGVLLAASSGR